MSDKEYDPVALKARRETLQLSRRQIADRLGTRDVCNHTPLSILAACERGNQPVDVAGSAWHDYCRAYAQLLYDVEDARRVLDAVSRLGNLRGTTTTLWDVCKRLCPDPYADWLHAACNSLEERTTRKQLMRELRKIAFQSENNVEALPVDTEHSPVMIHAPTGHRIRVGEVTETSCVVHVEAGKPAVPTGAQLRMRRKGLGWTLEDAAQATGGGCIPNNIERMETCGDELLTHWFRRGPLYIAALDVAEALREEARRALEACRKAGGYALAFSARDFVAKHLPQLQENYRTVEKGGPLEAAADAAIVAALVELAGETSAAPSPAAVEGRDTVGARALFDRVMQHGGDPLRLAETAWDDVVGRAAAVAVTRFGGIDGTFNAAGFSAAMREIVGCSSLDGSLVRAILSGRSDVTPLTPGDAHYRLRQGLINPQRRSPFAHTFQAGDLVRVINCEGSPDQGREFIVHKVTETSVYETSSHLWSPPTLMLVRRAGEAPRRPEGLETEIADDGSVLVIGEGRVFPDGRIEVAQNQRTAAGLRYLADVADYRRVQHAARLEAVQKAEEEAQRAQAALEEAQSTRERAQQALADARSAMGMLDREVKCS